MRLRVVLFTALATMVVAALAWATEPFNSSARWACFSGTCIIGSPAAPAIQIQTDGTGDGELTVPEGSIAADEVSMVTDHVIFCGQADENGTIYLGPATTQFWGNNTADWTAGSAGCDALDNATEATADDPLWTNVSYKIMGGVCYTDATLGAGESVIFTMRSAAADTTPQQTCTIGVGESDCSITIATTTDVAANATVAMKAVEASNNADDNLWCRMTIAYK